jgi:hypothetical protein
MTIEERLAELGQKLDELMVNLRTPSQTEWLTAAEFAQYARLRNPEAVLNLVRMGVFDSNDCLRNIGTEARPSYRFHQDRAMAALLERTACPYAA